MFFVVAAIAVASTRGEYVRQPGHALQINDDGHVIDQRPPALARSEGRHSAKNVDAARNDKGWRRGESITSFAEVGTAGNNSFREGSNASSEEGEARPGPLIPLTEEDMMKMVQGTTGHSGALLDANGTSPNSTLGPLSAVLSWLLFSGKPNANATVVQPDYSHDWLYGYPKTVCGEAQWDNTQSSVASRAFLPIFFLALVAATVFAGRSTMQEGPSDSPHNVEDVDEQPAQRRYDIDYARILCITCVVWEHSGGWQWSEHNTFFSQQWVLPFLYIASGFSFMMSRKSSQHYMARLSLVFVVGVTANTLADQLTGRNWRGDFGNTIFQMFYVALLLLVAIIAGPLREALRWRTRHHNDEPPWWHRAPLPVFGLLTCIGFIAFVASEELPIPDAVLNRIPIHVVGVFKSVPVVTVQVAGILLLCHVACLYRATDLLAWILLLHIYVPRIVVPWAGVGFPHNLELLIFAMVVQSWKIRGSHYIAETVRSYWPMLIFCLLLLSCADMQGRCDLVPAGSMWERLRFYSIELLLCLCLCTEGFKVGDPYNIDSSKWLNDWALYAYCFHVAWARIFPQPYGGVVTYSSCLFFFLRARSNYRSKHLRASVEKS